MKISEIYSFLNELSPFELQESWDNSGLLVGDWSSEVDTVVLSIDLDEVLIETLPKDALVITHHPLIFGGLKQLTFNQYPAKLLLPMIKNNISNIAMHTNFDITHLNDYVATEVLGYEIESKDGFVAYLNINQNYDEFAQNIKNRLGLTHIRGVKCSDFIKKAALVTGSGASLLKSIKADCFLTGDIKYHDAMEAKTIGVSMLDIGHYESERFFAEILAKHLEKLGLNVIIAKSSNPFTYL